MDMKLANRYLALPFAIAAIAAGSAQAVEVKSSVVLQGGSNTAVTWDQPVSPLFTLNADTSFPATPYKVFVWIAPDSTATNALYHVYPKGVSLSSTDCISTSPDTPCYEIPIDASKHLGEWVQLTLANDPTTQWNFVETFGKVKVDASNLSATDVLSTGSVLFESPTIGKAFQGGIIISLTPNGQHGLIAANQDLPKTYGLANARKAVKIASNYDAQGQQYSDWRIPTKDELNVVFQHKGILGAKGTYYWSSTMTSTKYAWLQIFAYPGAPSLNGYQGPDGTISYPTSIRPVRSF